MPYPCVNSTAAVVCDETILSFQSPLAPSQSGFDRSDCSVPGWVCSAKTRRASSTLGICDAVGSWRQGQVCVYDLSERRENQVTMIYIFIFIFINYTVLYICVTEKMKQHKTCDMTCVDEEERKNSCCWWRRSQNKGVVIEEAC